MEYERLVSLGFTANEAKIYSELLRSGNMQAGTISKKTQINRRTTYDTIERLLNKGYVSYSISSNKKTFHAANPEIIIKKIDEMRDSAKEIIPNLIKLQKTNTDEQEATIYKGRKGIRTILNEMLKVKSYVGFGSNEKFPEIMSHDFLLFQKRKKELGIKSKTLMNISMKGKDVLKTANTQYRFVKEKKAQPSSTFIYENKVAIIVWTEIPIGFVIENKILAKTYLDYFESLWNNATE